MRRRASKALVAALLLTAAPGLAGAAETAKAPAASPAAAPAPAAPPAGAAAAPAAGLPSALYGLSWGDPVAPGMAKLEARMPPGSAIYWREADKLELAGVPVKQILYIYEQGKLAGVSIQVAAPGQAALGAALTRSWGPPLITGDRTEWVTATLRAVLRPVDRVLYDLNVFPR